MNHKCWVEHDYELAWDTMDELPIHERRLVEEIETIAKQIYSIFDDISDMGKRRTSNTWFRMYHTAFKHRFLSSMNLVRNISPEILEHYLPIALSQRGVMLK